jgi:YVTN family beta-propeller protein
VGDNREAPPAEFRILGQLQVVVDGEERPIAGQKLQALLARLLLDANRPVSSDRLIDDLWGDEPPATARQSLHAHITRLRRLLARADDAGSALGNDGRGYVLRVEDDQLDATRFRALLAAAREERRAGRTSAARDRYRESLALWRGPVLDGVSLERAGGDRTELEALRLAALEEQVELDLELGRAAELVPELERLVQTDPLRESAWAQLMLALYASGRQADALAAYQNARQNLATLGLEPGPRLRELQHAILNQDRTLVTTPVRRVGRRRSAVSGRVVALIVALAAAAIVAGTVFALRDDAPSAAGLTSPRVVPNSLVEIDPATNAVASVTPVGRGPDSIAATQHAIWVVNVEDRTVARVSLPTRQVRVLGGAPVAHQVVSGLNGDVWLSSFEEPIVTLIANRGSVARARSFATGAHDLAAGPRRVELPGSAEGMAVGGGYLWVTSPSDSGGDDSVFRIDLRTRRLVSSIKVGFLPLFMTFGYGSAWIANYKGESVSVIRPGSTKSETIPLPGGPLGIAAGARGIWVVAFWTKDVVRIDPETRRVVRRIRVGAGPLAVTVGAGAVWVTNRDSKTISRIDPATNKVIATIHLTAAPYSMSFASGRLWVTTQRCGSPIAPC